MSEQISWNTLRKYGFNYLTGEACAIGMRGLVDMDIRGKRILEEVLGLPHDVELNPAVNGRGDDKWSAKIPHSLVTDLIVTAMFQHEGTVEVWVCEYTVIPWKKGELTATIQDFTTLRETIEDQMNADLNELIKMQQRCNVKKIYRMPTQEVQPHQGLNNIHAWSGRVL